MSVDPIFSFFSMELVVGPIFSCFCSYLSFFPEKIDFWRRSWATYAGQIKILNQILD